MEQIKNDAKAHGAKYVFAGVGERTWEGNDFLFAGVGERTWEGYDFLFAGVGERTWEGNDFYQERTGSGVIKLIGSYRNGSRYPLVNGQMIETPGARARISLTRLIAA